MDSSPHSYAVVQSCPVAVILGGRRLSSRCRLQKKVSEKAEPGIAPVKGHRRHFPDLHADEVVCDRKISMEPRLMQMGESAPMLLLKMLQEGVDLSQHRLPVRRLQKREAEVLQRSPHHCAVTVGE